MMAIYRKLLTIILGIIIYSSFSFAWYDTNYTYRYPIDCSKVETGMPVVINGSDGFYINDTQLIIWTPCNASQMYLYYKNYSDYIVSDDVSEIPYEVEYDNTTDDFWTDLEAAYTNSIDEDDDYDGYGMDTVNTPTRTQGCIIGECYDYDPNDRFTSTGDGFENFDNWGQMSFSGWVNFDDDNVATGVWSFYDDNQVTFQREGDNSMILYWQQDDTAWRIIDVTDTMTAAEGWVHVAWVWNGTFLTLYKNGAPVGNSSPNSIRAQPGDDCFGSNGACGNANINAQIDETYVWSRALTASEIANYYNGGSPIHQFNSSRGYKPKEVWDSEFAVVYHGDDLSDSVQLSLDLTNSGADDTNGYIDGAYDYVNSSDDYMTSPANTTLKNDPFTVITFFKPDTDGPGVITGVDDHFGATATHFGWTMRHNGSELDVYVHNGSSYSTHDKWTSTISSSGWNHVAFVYDGDDDMQGYVNGTADGSQTVNNAGTDVNYNVNAFFMLGARYYNTVFNSGDVFDGIIDETWYMNTNKSVDFINGTFQNILGTESFGSLGAMETYGVIDYAATVNYADVEPDSPNSSSNLTGYCNATDNESTLLNYYYRWWNGSTIYSEGEAYADCLQTEANISSTCGGNNTGYYYEGVDTTSFEPNHELEYYTDNNFSTYMQPNQSDANSKVKIYINYTMPSGTLNATWEVNDECGARNLSIHADCWLNATNTGILELVVLNSKQLDTIYYGCVYHWELLGVPQTTEPTLDASCTGGINEIAYEEQVFWKKTGIENGTVGTTEEAPSSALRKDEEWLVSCRAYDGNSNSSWLNSSSVTIDGVSPETLTSRIDPTIAYTNDTLGGYCNGSDNDEDAIIYYYKWFNGTTEYSFGNLSYTEEYQENYSTIGSGGVWLGGFGVDEATDGIWASDVYGICAAGQKCWFEVNYTKPSGAFNATWKIGNGATTSYQEYYKSIPSSCFDYLEDRIVLQVYLNRVDLRMNASCYNSTHWEVLHYRDGSTSNIVINEEAITWGLNGSISGVEQNVNNLTPYTTKKGEQWILSCLATDEDGNGSWVNSSTLTINNSLPVARFAFLNSTSIYSYTNDTLIGWCNASDEDGDTIGYNYSWYKNGSLFFNSTTAVTYTEGILVNVANISSDNTEKGNNWSISCSASDGAEYGSVFLSDNLTIQDAPPVIRQSNITPLTPNTSSTLEGWCNATDIDGDDINYYYRWFVDGAINETGNLSWYSEGVLLNVANISNTSLVEDQGWILSCLGNDDNSNSSWLNSTQITIDGIPPTTRTPEIEPTPAYTNDTLLGYCNSSDHDGDNVNYTYIWFRNNISIDSGRAVNIGSGVRINVNNLTNNNFNKTDEIVFSCQADDDDGNGSWVNSSVLTISNLAPVSRFAYLNSSSAITYTNDTLLGWCNISDEDANNISYKIEWFRNGVLYSNTTLLDNSGLFYTNVSYEYYEFQQVPDNYTNSSTITDPTRFFDGNESTTVIPQAGTNGYVYLNYTKPVTATNKSLFYFSYSGLSGYGQVNLSINSSCWDHSPTYVYIYGRAIQTGGVDFAQASCWNGTTWIIMHQSGALGFTELNESGMFWSNQRFLLRSYINATGNMPSANTTKGENWIFSCQGYDGEDYGNYLNSTQLTIQDASPIIRQSNITPLAPNTTTDLVGWCNATDIDGDTLGYNYTWYKNGTYFSGGNTTVIYTEGVLVNINNISSGDTNEGENWTFSCSGFDNNTYSTFINSSEITIVNSPPATENASIQPLVVYTGDELRGYCVGNDTDVSDRLIYHFKWYNGTSEYSSGISSNNYTQDVLINVNNISTNTIYKYEQWTFSCLAQDEEYNASHWINSTPITVQNTPPVIEELYSSPTHPLDTDNLSCNFNISDLDYVDNINVTISWFQSPDNISWSKIDDHNYTFPNITLNTLYTSDIGTGSVPDFDLNNYSSWICEITVVENETTVKQNASQVYLHPFRNITLYYPPNNTISNPPLPVNLSVEDLDNHINCTLEVLHNCYQETANSSSCGDESTGSYAFQPNYIYVNYTKPYNALPQSHWEVQHGTSPRYNISIPQSCWDASNTLQFRFITGRLTRAVGSCYNNTNWVNITNTSTGGACNGFPLADTSLFYDGNWSTAIQWNELTIDWEDMSSGFCYGKVYEDAMYWHLNESISRNNILNGTEVNITYEAAYNAIYYWNVTCEAPGQEPPKTTANYVYTVDAIPPSYSNYFNDTSILYPAIGDSVNMSVTVTEDRLLDTCKLQINDNGTWWDSATYVINQTGDYNLTMNFTIRTISTHDNNNVTWRVWCQDAAGNTATSNENNITVIDIVDPLIFLSGNNTFGTNNRTIVSSGLYNISLNVNFTDYNLYQAAVNITCGINGTIYYWEILDINTTSYLHNDDISLAGMPSQQCSVYIQASDDHTQDKIDKYKIKKDKGSGNLTFETTENVNVGIISEDEVDDFGTSRLEDRITFAFDYKDKKLNRSFIIQTDGYLYSRDDTPFPGHMVIWNPRVHRGNWLDLVDFSGLDLEIEVIPLQEKNKTKLKDLNKKDKDKDKDKDKKEKDKKDKKKAKYNYSDFLEDGIDKYKVIITSIIPPNATLEPRRKCPIVCDWMNQSELEEYYYGIDVLSFESIGGTNVYNATYLFYTGGYINLSTLNLYDNGTYIENWTVQIETLNSFPGVNGTWYIENTTERVENLTNGTYWFTFTHPQYLTQYYTVEVTNLSQSLVYETAQSQVNIIPRNVKSLALVPNVNMSVTNENTTDSRSVTNVDNVTTTSIFYLNASFYNLTATHRDYNIRDYYFNTSYQQNRTIYLDLYFNATFNLYDERTGGEFNISGADTVNFLLFCPDSTETTIINSTNFTIPVICEYTKFKIVLEYGTTSYYRSFIFEPEDVFNVSIFLIDLTNTQSILNTLILDDLLSDYENPSIFIKKVIGGNTEIITSDFIDVENKITAYLIENHEYVIEVHSDNNPIRVMGNYAADLAGEKVLRLYDISVEIETSGTTDSVRYSIMKQNISNTLYVVAYFNDVENATEQVKFNVYANTYGGAPVFTTTVVGNESMEFMYNMTQYINSSVWGELVIDHPDFVQKTATRQVNEDTRVSLGGITEYISQNFLDWFLTILLGVVAIYATIKTGNHVALGMIGLSALFILFGWYTLTWSVLVFAAMISLFMYLKKGEKSVN